jgi:hypothetical protein
MRTAVLHAHLPAIPKWKRYLLSSVNVVNQLSRLTLVCCLIRSVNNYFWFNKLSEPGWHVGIATGYGLGDRGVGVWVPVGPRIFISPNRPDRLWGPHSLLPIGTGTLSSGVKRPGREADHSPSTSAEVQKNVDLYIHSPIRLHGMLFN